MIKSIYSKGSAHVVVTVILVITLLGAVGFIFWQNFIKTEPVAQTQVEDGDNGFDQTAGEIKKEDEDYLTLDKWDVKFKLPDGLSGVMYFGVQNEDLFSYHFTTKRVESLGGSCSPSSSSGFTSLVAISRSKTPTSNTPVNDVPVDEYYYYVSHSSAVCAETFYELQEADSRSIMNMLKNPVSAK